MTIVNRIIVALVFTILAACSEEAQTDHYVGYVEAEYIYVAAPQAGWITKINIREGDVIDAGAVLFELDTDQQQAGLEQATARAEEARLRAADLESGARPEEIQALEAQLAEAQARLKQARSEYNRWMPLVREGNATKARGDQVRADFEAAEARVAAAEDAIAVARLAGRSAMQQAADAAAKAADAARDEAAWRLGERKVKARTGGRVEQVFRRAGEFTAAGATVVAILPADNLKVRFFVPQSEVSSFAIGDRIEVRADGQPEAFSATISFIAQEAEFTPPVIYSAEVRDKLVFLVEARLPPDTPLRPGLPVDVRRP